jgi:subfamily B ATP-binding cassette protein MsbA
MDVYKRLLQFAADYRGLLLSAAAGALLEGVAGGAFLAMMKPVIDETFIAKNREVSYWLPLAIVGLLCCAAWPAI